MAAVRAVPTADMNRIAGRDRSKGRHTSAAVRATGIRNDHEHSMLEAGALRAGGWKRTAERHGSDGRHTTEER